RNGNWNTPYLFNAKELDEETGLYYYGARYLDPTGAMWLSVDPMWNNDPDKTPYNYCLNNPIKMVDPDGRNGCVKKNLELYLGKYLVNQQMQHLQILNILVIRTKDYQ
ncbi:MAG: RHS repeat-associated core domain-containing protein, partial [Aeriscardovia sp.]|nr:RHS repeat-associated core domain-containing protein [Aeriscardovia sp.]